MVTPVPGLKLFKIVVCNEYAKTRLHFSKTRGIIKVEGVLEMWKGLSVFERKYYHCINIFLSKADIVNNFRRCEVQVKLITVNTFNPNEGLNFPKRTLKEMEEMKRLQSCSQNVTSNLTEASLKT